MSDNIEDKILEKLPPKPEEINNSIVEILKQSNEISTKLDNIIDNQVEIHSVVADTNKKIDINNPHKKLDNIIEIQSEIHSVTTDIVEEQSETQETVKDFSDMYKKDTRTLKAKIIGYIEIAGIVITISPVLIGGAKFLRDRIPWTTDEPHSTSVSNIPATEEFSFEDSSEELSSEPAVENSSVVSTEEISSEVEEQTVDEKVYPDDYVIQWEDENFGNMVEKCLGKDSVTYSDVKNIKTLDIYGQFMFLDTHDYGNFEGIDNSGDMYYKYKGQKYDFSDNISLNDLKYFYNLSELSVIYFNSIDIEVFLNDILNKNVTLLEFQYLKLDEKQMRYISNLKNLESLSLTVCDISNLDFLSNMSRLKSLGLCSNDIKDITPLANLKSLQYLDLHNNNISNIEPLRLLRKLEKVYLDNNNITDWSPVSHVETTIKTDEEMEAYYKDH